LGTEKSEQILQAVSVCSSITRDIAIASIAGVYQFSTMINHLLLEGNVYP
jgi:hypothetical protein